MAKIQTIPKSRLRNNEWLAAGRAIELQIQTAGVSALGVTIPFENFQKALQAYDDSLVKLSKSALTSEMSTADKKRDSLQSAILGQIRTFANHFEADKQTAAKRLIPFADTYKNTTWPDCMDWRTQKSKRRMRRPLRCTPHRIRAAQHPAEIRRNPPGILRSL